MRFPALRWSFVIAASFLSLQPTAYSQEKQPCELDRFLPDTEALRKTGDTIQSKAGTEVILLCDDTSYIFDSSGKYVRTDYLTYKILSQKGAEGWDGLSVRWEPWHQDKPTVRARVISADGSVHVLDPKTTKDETASDEQQKVYSDGHFLRGPLPAVAPGAIVEQEVVITEHDPQFPDGIVERSYFGGGVPVAESRLILDAPSSMKLNFESQLLPELKVERVEAGGRLRVTFRQGRLEALENAPPNLPNDIPGHPAITFSTARDWQSIASSYAAIVDRQIDAAGLQARLSGLLKDKKTKEEKMEAVLQFLGSEIRYTGVEFGESAIVPQAPAEVLKRKYGDCKDKASLMVAMLRSAGIPAYVALLNAGSRQDVSQNLPGMGMFDHAIVYVPGGPDYWIDVTDEYARLGQLPYVDQGRYSLIVKSDTTALTKIPESSSVENLVSQTREFLLAENGPARVVEKTVPKGIYEGIFRAYYADVQNKDTRSSVADYIKNTYLSDNLGKIDRTDPQSLLQPFQLTMEASKAKRGTTDLDRAVVAIRLEDLFRRLPEDLREQGEDSKKERSPDEPKKKPRTEDYQLPNASMTEWNYHIVPPIGFLAMQLPESKKEQLGPGSYSQEFRLGADGSVEGVLRFDTSKRRLSAAESQELQKSVVAMLAREPILIWFEPKATKLRDEGKMKESMQAYRELVAAHPKEALHHLQIAKALLDAGLGNGAREEARTAVVLEPNSALAQETLAEILEYDLVGRKMRPGSDYAGAEQAYRAAIKLDPEKKLDVANLAILLEFDRWGLRYGPTARLKDALTEYGKLTKEDLSGFGLQNNLAFTLFYSGQFADAQKEALNLNPRPISLLVACSAMLTGVPSALTEAQKDASSEQQMKDALKAAGDMLTNLRYYEIGAALMEAGANGASASDVAADALIFKRTRRHEELQFQNDPAGAALKFIYFENDVNLTAEKFRTICSRNGGATLATPAATKATAKDQREVYSSKSRSGEFPDVGIDLSLARALPKAEGSDATGYKVTVWGNASYKKSIYVVKEEGQYKVLATSKLLPGAGLEIVDRVTAGDLNGARVLLDWLRQDEHLAIDDDPLSGGVFPRLWTAGKAGDAVSMKLAAAALICNRKESAKQALDILLNTPSVNPSQMEMQGILMAKMTAYAWLLDSQKAAEFSRQLYEQYPESRKAFINLTFHLRVLGKFDEVERLAEERGKRLPNDPANVRARALSARDRGDYQTAHDLVKQLVATGNGDAWDMNDFVWYALFTGRIASSDLEDAVKAAELTKKSSAVLHTLGCAYAEVGKTKEAKDVLIQALDRLNFDEPEDNYWYAFGRIAEQYGEKNLAIEDYNKVNKPEYDFQLSQSAYKLAQIRLAIQLPHKKIASAQCCEQR